MSFYTSTIPSRNIYTPCVVKGLGSAGSVLLAGDISMLCYLYMLCVAMGMCEFFLAGDTYTPYGIRRVYSWGRGFTGYIPVRGISTPGVVKGACYTRILWNIYTPWVVTEAKFLREYSIPGYTCTVCSYRGEFFLPTGLYPLDGIRISRVFVYTRAEFT